ncbi:unnamed protein product [Sphagnum troendelagicum]|uniref:Glucose-6-phosphate 1-dehydrogenase n=1 Tax=Sphagnum troendelagicum TaxID=128251 RepID=A0ABP0UEN5_9BRYO
MASLSTALQLGFIPPPPAAAANSKKNLLLLLDKQLPQQASSSSHQFVDKKSPSSSTAVFSQSGWSIARKQQQQLNGQSLLRTGKCPVLGYSIQLLLPESQKDSIHIKRQLEIHAHAEDASSKGDDTKRHVAMQSLPPGMSTALGSPPVEVEKFPVPDGYSGWNIADLEPFLSITVVGATGDLARNKIFPALFALYYGGSLPKKVAIFGFSRSILSNEEFRELISESLLCRVDLDEDCGDKTELFLQSVYYEHGNYSGCDGMSKLDERLQQVEGAGEANRIFYLSLPHNVVLEVATCLSADAQSKRGWTRLILEKPFGFDSESSARINQGLLRGLDEKQIYRIDHHMGKELIENLTVLRFSNLVFEPLWTRTYIRNVQVIVAEDQGMDGRGRYFDQHGVIRDIVQSHILQTIALFAMEPPVSLDGEDIRNEKVKVLRSMRKVTLDDIVLGQYKSSISNDGKYTVPGYTEEPGVNPNSLTPTFVAGVFYIDNARWDGVPFLIEAGFGLIEHKVEIRIQFHHVPGNLYRGRFGLNGDTAMNELIIAVLPDEGIFLKINNKVPGLGVQLDSSELNLLYRDKYEAESLPDSYERLILDVIDGDNHLFIRGDELDAAWALLTPLLEDIAKHKVVPELYTFGGRGPVGAYYLAAKHNVPLTDQ